MGRCRSTRGVGRLSSTAGYESSVSTHRVEELARGGSGAARVSRQDQGATISRDVWSEDPASPALRCLQRNLHSLTLSARDVLILLTLCARPAVADERGAAVTASLDEAVDAVHALVDSAHRAAAALDRALTAPW
jgi:hypothetical protein